MRRGFYLLQLLGSGQKTAQFSFLAFLLIMACVMLGCDQAELASSSPEVDALTYGQMQFPQGFEPEIALSSNGRIRVQITQDQEPELQSAESLADRVVKIGLIMEFVASVNTKYGAELAMMEINQSGGVLGIPIALLDGIEPTTMDGRPADVYGPHQQKGDIMGGLLGYPIGLVVRDNRDDPALSETLAEELIIQDEVVAIIGPGYSRNALRVAEVAQRFEVPMVATTATNPDVTMGGDFAFLAAFADTFQGEVMARFAREFLKAKTAALLTDSGDPYSRGLSDFFEEHFTAMGGRVVVSETYATGDTDFSTQLTAIAAEIPDVVFMPGFTPEVPLAIKQARTTPQRNASAITATFLGGDGWDEQDLVSLGGEAMEDTYFSTLFSAEASDEASRDFVRAYQTQFGMVPDLYAAMGYDALRLVATAIRRAGSIDNYAIRDQLAATKGYQGATRIESYNEDGHPIKSAVIMRIRDGRVEFHQTVEHDL